jgi:hypothetical protein
MNGIILLCNKVPAAALMLDWSVSDSTWDSNPVAENEIICQQYFQ